jgi:hypothetical protein
MILATPNLAGLWLFYDWQSYVNLGVTVEGLNSYLLINYLTHPFQKINNTQERESGHPLGVQPLISTKYSHRMAAM